ncbi:hypothetical protein NL676_019653 [Syzygium grande]|nr:hypothetical protein NL676_019653 [Syzygium grande]
MSRDYPADLPTGRLLLMHRRQRHSGGTRASISKRKGKGVETLCCDSNKCIRPLHVYSHNGALTADPTDLSYFLIIGGAGEITVQVFQKGYETLTVTSVHPPRRGTKKILIRPGGVEVNTRRVWTRRQERGGTAAAPRQC